MTYEEIAAAAEELQATGITPTQVKVKEKLGRGSYRDIANHLKTWREKQENAATATAATELPAELITALANATANMRMQEKDRHSAAINAANLERDEISETLARKEEELTKKEEELVVARREMDIANGQLTAIKEQLKKIEYELTQTRERNAELERQIAKQQAIVLNAEETKKENISLRAENKELLARAVRAEAIAETLTSKTPDEKNWA